MSYLLHIKESLINVKHDEYRYHHYCSFFTLLPFCFTLSNGTMYNGYTDIGLCSWQLLLNDSYSRQTLSPTRVGMRPQQIPRTFTRIPRLWRFTESSEKLRPIFILTLFFPLLDTRCSIGGYVTTSL